MLTHVVADADAVVVAVTVLIRTLGAEDVTVAVSRSVESPGMESGMPGRQFSGSTASVIAAVAVEDGSNVAAVEAVGAVADEDVRAISWDASWG